MHQCTQHGVCSLTVCTLLHTHTQDFEQTLSLVSDYQFPSLFINQFYPRPGTPAARMRRIPTHEVAQFALKDSDVCHSTPLHVSPLPILR